MSYNPLTASEAYRSYEIQNHNLVFEPITNHNYAIQYNLFSAQPGQQYAPSLIISAPFSSSGVIQIEKDIHVFNDQNKADEFINSLDPLTQYSVVKSFTTHSLFEGELYIEVHIINYPRFDVIFNYINQDIVDGFYVKVYQSGSFSNGTNIREIYDESKVNEDGSLISNTYLTYFKINSDK